MTSATALKLFFQFPEMFPDRLPEQAQSRLGNQSFFVLPLAIIDQVILEAAETHVSAAENVAGFETLTQLPVNEKFIPIRKQAFCAAARL